MPSYEKMSLDIQQGRISQDTVAEKGYMTSIDTRVKKYKQPHRGFLNIRKFDATVLGVEGEGVDELYPKESTHNALIEATVNQLARFMTTPNANVKDIFSNARHGASQVKKDRIFNRYSKLIKGLDNKSIDAAVRLAGFDVVIRKGAIGYSDVEGIVLSRETKQNIRIMTHRLMQFWHYYGHPLHDAVAMDGAYTGYIVSGKADYISTDTVWSINLSKQKPTIQHILYLLICWRMGLRSIHQHIFKKLHYIGFYSPRQNVVYRIHINHIPADIIKEIDTKVIGYDY